VTDWTSPLKMLAFVFDVLHELLEALLAADVYENDY
jgi:hypothetical protein